VTSAIHSPRADLTATQRGPQPTPPEVHHRRFIFCPHKGSTTGAYMRGKLPMRCAACVKRGKGG